MESKPHERIDLLSVNIFQTKKSILIVMKTCLRETDEAIWESPFQLTPPPRPLFLSNIFITPLFVKWMKKIFLYAFWSYF